MLAHAFGQTLPRSVSNAPVAAFRNRLDSAPLGNLAILASTTTGEVADPMPAVAHAARITLLRSRSALNV